MRPPLAGLALLAAVARSACGETMIDAEEQEEFVRHVQCPDIVVVRTGRLLRCAARATGTSRTVSVRLTDDRGRFRYRLAER